MFSNSRFSEQFLSVCFQRFVGGTSNINSLNPTYCSKLVYQAYKNGTMYPLFGVGAFVHPYDFLNKVGYSAKGKIVASVKW